MNHLSRPKFASALLFILFAAAASAPAQVAGRLSGSVVDPSGAPIPNATVRLILEGGASAVIGAVSNGEGRFLFPSVRPESYTVVIEAKGFRKNALLGVKISASQETPVGGVKLEIGSVSEVVEVSAATQAVQTTNAEVASSITNEQLRNLPTMDRSPTALLLTQAGVSANSRSSPTVNAGWICPSTKSI